MSDERLKLILTVLGGVIFAMFFILIALVIPIHKKSSYQYEAAPKSKLEHISKTARDR